MNVVLTNWHESEICTWCERQKECVSQAKPAEAHHAKAGRWRVASPTEGDRAAHHWLSNASPL
jgi:hypothetical protein